MARLPLHLSPVSLDLAWADPEENFVRIRAAVRGGLEGGGPPPEERLFLLPELTLTAFVTKDPPSFALDPPHKHVAKVLDLARELRTGIVFGFPEVNPDDPDKPFNTLVLAGPDGKIAGRYRKMHLFTVGKTPETASYSAGPSGTVFDYRGWKIALAVCFDMRFSRLFHSYAQAGADLILVSACWLGGEHKAYQFRTLNSSFAILSQAYLAAVNRKGKDPFFTFEGGEYVFSPFGENLHDGNPVRLDPAVLDSCRKLQVRPSDRDDY